MLFLDTSALIYWTLDPGRLTEPACRAIAAADQIAISSISIWEVGLKVKRGRLEIPLPIADYVGQLQRIEQLQILAVDVPTWLANLALDWDHRDPADRTIVATARLLDCSLVTSDRLIADFYPETIW